MGKVLRTGLMLEGKFTPAGEEVPDGLSKEDREQLEADGMLVDADEYEEANQDTVDENNVTIPSRPSAGRQDAAKRRDLLSKADKKAATEAQNQAAPSKRSDTK